MGPNTKRRGRDLWTMGTLMPVVLGAVGFVASCIQPDASVTERQAKHRLDELASAVSALDGAENRSDHDAAYYRAQHAVIELGNLGRNGADAVPMLLELMQGPDRQDSLGDFSLHVWAADALRRIGEPALPAVVQLVEHHDPLVRRLALNNLAQWSPESQQTPVIPRSKLNAAVPVLKRAIKDESDPSVTAVLRSTLRLIDPAQAEVP